MRGTPFAGPRAVRRGGCRAHHGGGGQVRALPRVMRDPGREPLARRGTARRAPAVAVIRTHTFGRLRIRHGDALIDHVHIPAGRGLVVLAGRRRVSQRLPHQVQHGPQARRGRRRVWSPVYSSDQVFARNGVDFLWLEFF